MERSRLKTIIILILAMMNLALALSLGRAGDVILLAGKGHETYQEIQGVQYPLDERKVVADWFKKEDFCQLPQGKGQKETGKVPADVV